MGGNLDFYEALASEPGTRVHLVRFVGGTAAVTKTFGRAMAVTYVSTGVVDLDFSGNANNPGTLVGMIGTFQSTVPGDLKGFTVVPGVYNSTTKKLRLSIYNSSFTLADLAALNWLMCVCYFKQASDF